MPPQEFDDLLLQTFEDQQLSRKEKELIKELLAETRPDDQKLALYRSQAFAVARSSLADPQAGRVLDWLEEVVKALQARAPAATGPTPAEAYFAPGDDCPRKIAHLIGQTRQRLDVCVFTVTDDRISRPILDAHRRGVRVRVITDGDKAVEPGSDVESFARAGVAVRADHSEYHMHHKFALFDDATVLTGSYNWTRGAAEYNEENFVVTADPHLVRQFAQAFERLWTRTQPLRP